MGLFRLIEQRKFQEFRHIYEEKAGIREQNPEFADLIPGNYILALLGLKDYHGVVDICMKHISENANCKGASNRSSSKFYVACAIAKIELGQVEDAYKILYEGRNAKYQDISRTEVACAMYYEAVMFHDTKARKTSIKLLNEKIKGETGISKEFAIAGFILGKCTEHELLNQMEGFVPVLRERHKMKALFYMAMKRFEDGDVAKYVEYLQEASSLYYTCPTVTVEPEYYMTQICLSKISAVMLDESIVSKSNSIER